MSATWLPTIPPNHRHWSRAWATSSVTYAGAATQIVTIRGIAPGILRRPSRTAPIVHAVMSGSASCRMNPSATSPISCSAFGP